MLQDSGSQIESWDIPLPADWDAALADNPAILYQGELEIQDTSGTVAGAGIIGLSLKSEVNITFRLEHQTPFWSEADTCRVRIPEFNAHANGIVLSSHSAVSHNGELSVISGILTEPLTIQSFKDDGTPEPVGRVQFYVVNLPSFHGTSLYAGSGDSFCFWRGRTSFEFGKWKITVDQARDSRERQKEAKASGHCVIAHHGIIERSDQRLFDPADGRRALDALYWFLAFLSGRRCPCLLPTGRRHLAHHLWQEWNTSQTSPVTSYGTWFIDHAPERCFEAASGYYSCWLDESKRSWLTLATGLYVAASHTTSGIELALANSQVALEMLTWVALLEENCLMSEAGFGQLSAADKIRALLFWLQVDPAVPRPLRELRATRAGCDAPQTVTEIRNLVIHPTKTNRARRAAYPVRAIYQAWQFNLWIIELTLLKLTGYSGPYRNRIGNPSGKAWDVVPWLRA